MSCAPRPWEARLQQRPRHLVVIAASLAMHPLGCQLISGGSDYEVSSGVGGTGPAVTALWAKNFGDSLDDSSTGVASDSQGNVVIVGSFKGDIGFEPAGVFTAVGETDIYVAKLSPQGDPVWAKSYGSDGEDYAADVAIDAQGDIYVTGEHAGEIDFGAGGAGGGSVVPHVANGDIFVVKLDGSNGSAIWAKGYGGDEKDRGWGIAVDSNLGTTAVTGSFRRSVHFGDAERTATGADNDPPDIFLLRLDADDGSTKGSASYGSQGSDDGMDVAFDDSGNILLAANFNWEVNFGQHVENLLTAQGGPFRSWDIAVAKFDHDGNHSWSRSFGDGDNELIARLAVDGSNGVLLVGGFSGQITFDRLLYASGSLLDTDGFVARLSDAGQPDWSAHIVSSAGMAEADANMDVAMDANDNAFVTGWCLTSVEFGPKPVDCDEGDVYLAKYDPSGALTWATRYGGADFDLPIGVSVDPSNNVLVTGAFVHTIEFSESVTIQATGEGADAFVAKFAP